MKKRIILIVLVGLLVGSILVGQDANRNQQPCKWIEQALLGIQGIKPGMTRADLQKMFVASAGLYSPSTRIFEYRECPYIKVDVEFEAQGIDSSGRQLFAERPTDKIIKISHPYLAMTHYD